MTNYLLKRLLNMLPVMLGVITLVALIMHITPGDPVDLLLGDFATGEEKTSLRRELGLDKDISSQLRDYFLNLAKGDLGDSLIYHQPVTKMIAERIPATIELAVLAIIVAILLSIPLGVVSAIYRNSWIDHFASTVSMVGIAIPNFFLGPLLILLVSIELGWLPVSGRDGFMTYILPSFTMGTALAAILTRITRNAMIEQTTMDFIRTAKAKGVKNTHIIFAHALKNAAIPIITIIGLQLGVLLTGAVVTETIFDWPGLGSLMIDALGNRDYPLIQGCLLCFSCTYLLTNLFIDILYTAFDPQIELE